MTKKADEKMIPKTREEILDEYTRCMHEAVRLRHVLSMILLCIEFSSGKMREKLEAVAGMSEDALYAKGRWKGVEDFADFMRSDEYKGLLLTEKKRTGGLQ